MGKRKYHKSKSLLSPTDYSVFKEVRKVKKKKKPVKKKSRPRRPTGSTLGTGARGKSIVYQRKQKQKQPRQKQSQSIVVHIHPKKTKSRPRFKNYSHEKAQKYFSSHYQTMSQSRAGYSLYNTLQVQKVLDALKGEKNKAAELREFYVNKYGAHMGSRVKLSQSNYQNINIEPEVKLSQSNFQNINIEPNRTGISIGTSTDPNVVVSDRRQFEKLQKLHETILTERILSKKLEPNQPAGRRVGIRSPRIQRLENRGGLSIEDFDIPPRSMIGERGQPTKSDSQLQHWLDGRMFDSRKEREEALKSLSLPDLERRAELFGKYETKGRPAKKRNKQKWIEYNATF
tara:strand:+ start:4869 stop:5897 length:1029 start_codon:yes stop_codon:yes gene_type:complete